MSSQKEFYYTVPVTVQLEIYPQDIEDILTTAFEGGINYWCDHINVPGGLKVRSAAEQLNKGGTLEMVDVDGDSTELTLDKFLKGLTRYLAEAPGPIDGDIIDSLDLDAEAADIIIQYALFGELIYS